MKNKTKKIVGFSLLFIILIVIKLFLGGTYLYHFWEELIPEILVLLIVSFILMIVPLIFKLINRKRIEYKKGKIVCLFNSLILFILFSIPNLLSRHRSETERRNCSDRCSPGLLAWKYRSCGQCLRLCRHDGGYAYSEKFEYSSETYDPHCLVGWWRTGIVWFTRLRQSIVRYQEQEKIAWLWQVCPLPECR